MKDEIGVIHGRFQILHNDHLKYLLAGMGQCNHLVIGITNPDPSLTKDEEVDPHRSEPGANPLTYYERYKMVESVLEAEGLNHHEFSIVPFPINRPELYKYYVPMDAVFYLTIYDDWGRRKREYFLRLGLKMKILWEKPSSEKGLTSSDIRSRILNGAPWHHLVPIAVKMMMIELDMESRLKSLVR